MLVRRVISCLAGAFVFAAVTGTGVVAQEAPLIQLSIEEPGGPILSDDAKTKPGKVKDKDPNEQDPLLSQSGWTMAFRLAAPESVAVVSTRLAGAQGGPNYETLVLQDPDGCLDLSHAIPDWTDPNFTRELLPLEANCPVMQDEIFTLFNIDRYDEPGVFDTYVSGGCEGPLRDSLIDDKWEEIQTGVVPYNESNKPYVVKFPLSTFNNGSPVGPFTGGTESTFDPAATYFKDCYGYGTDEDVRSLVVMVNQGGARIFDGALNYDNTRIRNMAGFISGVGYELLDKSNATAIVAHMPVTQDLLMPLTFFDIPFDFGFNTDGTGFPDPLVIKRKIEDGPVETLTLERPDTSAFSPTAEFIQTLIELTANEFTVDVRAVVVDGEAPRFIDDMDNDGAFTAADVELMGYTLRSNEALRSFNITSTLNYTDEQDRFECPPLNLVDLDLDGIAGSCDDGDGTSRSKTRVPR